MEVPLLVAFLVLLYRLQPQLRAVGNAWITLAATRGSVREVEWLLRAQDRHPPMQGWLVPPALDGAIVFDRVSYAYPGAIAASLALRRQLRASQRPRGGTDWPLGRRQVDRRQHSVPPV